MAIKRTWYNLCEYLSDNYPNDAIEVRAIEDETAITEDIWNEKVIWQEGNPTAKPTWSSISADFLSTRTTELQKIEDDKTADATNKASGNQKLLDLGLTQAEATALTGYTPPSEV